MLGNRILYSTFIFPLEMLANLPFKRRFFKEDNLSVNNMPSIWSYSCWITLAKSPS